MYADCSWDLSFGVDCFQPKGDDTLTKKKQIWTGQHHDQRRVCLTKHLISPFTCKTYYGVLSMPPEEGSARILPFTVENPHDTKNHGRWNKSPCTRSMTKHLMNQAWGVTTPPPFPHIHSMMAVTYCIWLTLITAECRANCFVLDRQIDANLENLAFQECLTANEPRHLPS